MTSVSSFQDYVSRIGLALSATSSKKIEEVIEIILNCSDNGGTIWLIGNGGSASTSSHFATDLSRCTNTKGEPIRGVSLCDNSSLITAIGNDFGFQEIFVKQLSNLAQKNDLLISISASGNSENVIKAIEYAKTNSIKTVSLNGFNGGKAHGISDCSIHVPTNIGDYGVAEDAHSIISHFICSQMRNFGKK
jgi:D-sedoheptulose 7-phosphate isomerase